MKRLFVTIFILMCISSILIACSNIKSLEDPEIKLNLSVTELSDEDFMSLGTKGLENATKNDFRNIDFTLEVNHTKNVTDRKINIPDFKANLNNNEKRYWFGNTYSQDNGSENFARYGDKFVIYSKGLDDQAIRDLFKGLEVKITWTQNSKESKEKFYKMDEMIQFKK